MKTSNPNDTETQNVRQFPRRDWFLLPAMSLLTILVLAVSTESVSRCLFPVSQTDLENCFVTGDPSGTAPAKPNSVCSERSAESRLLVDYRFNGRGDRDDRDLQEKQAGSFRIVMIGSSFAMGLFAPRELSFAGLLPEQLSRQTGRRIELYNESKGGKFRGGPFPIKNSVARFQDVLSAQPDMILWIITPMDIENSELNDPDPKPGVVPFDTPRQDRRAAEYKSALSKMMDSMVQGNFGSKLRNRWAQSRSALMLRHFLVSSEPPNQYVESYLKNEDDAEFLKIVPSAEWQQQLQNFETQAERFEAQARMSGVPFVGVLVPNRAQAAMISTNSWPSDYDPYRLDHELRKVIENNGGIYIDILKQFRSVPDPEQVYFPLDGHLNVEGHAMISRMLTNELTSGAVPSMSESAHPQLRLAQGK